AGDNTLYGRGGFMESLSLAVLLSVKKSGNRRRGRRRRRRRSGSGNRPSKETSPAAESEEIERALARFSTNPRPMGIPKEIDPPPKRIDLRWRTNAVSKEVQRKAGKIACIPGEFGFLPEERVQEIASKLDYLPITLEQALSLRSALNQEKSVYSYSKLMHRSNELSRRYNAGESIIALSKRFDAPPVNTFRAVLTGRGWTKNRIKETLNKNPSKLNKRDREQFELAESVDRVSSVNQTETQNAAEVFEVILCDYFSSVGVRFRRQEDLLAEQKVKEGRAIITPDLLLLDDVRINDIPCAWIDAKHFFGADLKFPKKKTQKQVDRYVAEYGQGAIVYRHGFCGGLKLRGAIQLDASPLDLKPLEDFHEKMRNGS
ncbi:MAG: TPD domain-containing protein, partial [Candidatus Thermoplasmatota archaeon]|nr:TPD domain-containing protein [Candidatus Thermoplasmatota archaeon]